MTPSLMLQPASNRAQRRQAQRQARRVPTPARQPRPIMANAMDVVRNRASRLTDDERQRMLAPAVDGFRALRAGAATHDQWAGVASAVNVGLAIESQGIVKGLLGPFHAAERALHAIFERVTAAPDCATWGSRTPLHAAEITALREAVNLHAFQLAQLSVSELHAAIERVRREIRSAGGQEMPAPASSIPTQTQPTLP